MRLWVHAAPPHTCHHACIAAASFLSSQCSHGPMHGSPPCVLHRLSKGITKGDCYGKEIRDAFRVCMYKLGAAVADASAHVTGTP